MSCLQITDRDNDEQFKRFSTLVLQLAQSKLKSPEGNLEDAIRTLAEEAVQKNESAEIEEQKKVHEITSTLWQACQ